MEKLPLTSFLQIFDELYLGVQDFSWVIDREPGLGFTNVIRNISAEEASQTTHAGGSTIAAHTEHLRWSLNFALTYLQGGQPDTDWNKSWLVKTVNQQEWESLQTALQNEYMAVRAAVEAVTDWQQPHLLNGVMALLPHAAYHLSAVKQILLVVRQ